MVRFGSVTEIRFGSVRFGKKFFQIRFGSVRWKKSRFGRFLVCIPPISDRDRAVELLLSLKDDLNG